MTKYKLPEIELKYDRYCNGCTFVRFDDECNEYYCCIKSIHLKDENSDLIRLQDCPLIEVKDEANM